MFLIVNFAYKYKKILLMQIFFQKNVKIFTIVR